MMDKLRRTDIEKTFKTTTQDISKATKETEVVKKILLKAKVDTAGT